MSGRFDPLRVEYFDRTSQFSDANLVHRYIENRFITERLSIYIDDVKKHYFLIYTAFNMPRLSENQTI